MTGSPKRLECGLGSNAVTVERSLLRQVRGRLESPVDAAGLDYFLDYGNGAKERHLATTAANILRRNHDGAKPHRAKKGYVPQINEQKLGASRQHVHVQIDGSRTFNVQLPSKRTRVISPAIVSIEIVIRVSPWVSVNFEGTWIAD